MLYHSYHIKGHHPLWTTPITDVFSTPDAMEKMQKLALRTLLGRQSSVGSTQIGIPAYWSLRGAPSATPKPDPNPKRKFVPLMPSQLCHRLTCSQSCTMMMVDTILNNPEAQSVASGHSGTIHHCLLDQHWSSRLTCHPIVWSTSHSDATKKEKAVNADWEIASNNHMLTHCTLTALAYFKS